MAPLFHLRGYLRRHLGALALGVVFVICGSGVALLGAVFWYWITPQDGEDTSFSRAKEPLSSGETP